MEEFEFVKTSDDLYDRALRIKGESWRPRGGVVYTTPWDKEVVLKLIKDAEESAKGKFFPKNESMPVEVRALIHCDIQVSPMVIGYFRKGIK